MLFAENKDLSFKKTEYFSLTGFTGCLLIGLECNLDFTFDERTYEKRKIEYCKKNCVLSW